MLGNLLKSSFKVIERSGAARGKTPSVTDIASILLKVSKRGLEIIKKK
jgi:hypothetical protein